MRAGSFLTGGIRSAARPGSLAVCALFALAWSALAPPLRGAPIVVQLGALHPDDPLELPPNALRAPAGPAVEVGRRQRVEYALELSRGGRFSVYGISSNASAQPLELAVNGRPVSATAFYQRTGSVHGDFQRHFVARGVRFATGENTVRLFGPRVTPRSFVLELRREEPAPLRAAALFLAAAVLLALRRWVTLRFPLSPRRHLALAALLCAVFLLALPTAAALLSDGHLLALGERDPLKTLRLHELEQNLRSEAYAAVRQRKSIVFVFGDSTHYLSLEAQEQMVPALRRALPPAARERLALWGVAGAAFSAFDFYLLLNRVADERPALVVMPVSLRSFADGWLLNERYRFHDMDHYVRPAELPRALGLTVAGREIPLTGWLLRRLDAAALDGRAGLTLRGAKVFFERERERVGRRLAGALFPSGRALPVAQPAPQRRWNTAISPDHPLFDAYRRINDLARRRGIPLLYYTVQVNVEAQRERGREVRPRENFATIEAVIGGAPGVHFLDLAGENPREMFSDPADHLTPEGMRSVAGALAAEIAALTSEGRPPSARR